jgi:tetratricopeptide (TPR) repeat protein
LLTGLTYARNQVWANELTLWQDVVEKSPNKVRPHINYGKALYGYSWGDVKEVKREFEIARTLCPECSMAYHNLAFIYWKEGDSETAIELYREALKRAPDYKEALYQSGKLYKELNQWHEARINLERLVKLSLGYQFVPAYLDLIDVYLELGLRNEALQLAEIMTRIPDGLPSLDYYRGLAFYKLQDFAEAKSYFTRQAARGTKLHSTCLMLGQIHYLEGDYDQAEAAFGRAIEVSPWSAMAHSNLAMVLEKRGRLAEASEHLEKARAVQPFSIDTTIRLVVLYDRLGDLSRRTELLRKLLRLNPNSSNFAYLKANMNRDLSQTLNGYAKRFLSGDGSSDTLEALAIIATLREDFGTAIRQYEAYLETLNNQSKKQRVAKEVLRLERLLSGEETLRTPV